MNNKTHLHVSDIMTRDVIALHRDQTLFEARRLMAAHQFRNVPVVGEDRRFVGIVTQMAVLREALRVNGTYGNAQLDRRLADIGLESMLESDCKVLSSDTPIVDAGRMLLDDRWVSMAVVDDGQLVGILSVSEYVRLAIKMLEGDERRAV